MKLAGATTLERGTIQKQKMLSPFKMPEGKPSKDEKEPQIYIVRIKKDAPFESETIAGAEITKHDFAADSFTLENAAKQSKEKTVKTFKWFKNQKYAFVKRAKEIEKTIVVRNEDGKRERKMIELFDYLDIMTIDEFHNAERPKMAGAITP